MGSVASLTQTGDNDPELTPTKYFRHCLYCDACGSFEIQDWIEPQDYLRISSISQKFSSIGMVFLVGFIIGCLFMLAMVVKSLLWGSPILDGDVLTLFVISLMGMFVSRAVGKFWSSKIRYRGLRCAACKAEYLAGSSFQNNLDANPRNFTMADAPDSKLYWVKGKYVDDSEVNEKEQPRSHLPA